MSLPLVFDSLVDLLHKKEENGLLYIEVFESLKPLLNVLNVDERQGFDEWIIRSLKKNTSYLSANVHDDADFIAESMMLSNVTENIDVSESLKRLSEVGKSHAQRTPEWFAYRKNVITASSLGKIFESEASNYNFMKEKVILDNVFHGSKATEFGVRFEDTAQSIYEDITHTKVSEYGCVPHSEISHIGASPDGIVTESFQDEYLLGRMLEIKCLYSRNLTGLPKYIYWVQCQIQLEVCNLEYCDFFECNLKEYNTIHDLVEAISNRNPKYCGILIELLDENGAKEKVLVSEIKNTKESINKWYDENVEIALNSGYSIVFKGWTLEKYSRLTIKRNRKWFESRKEQIQTFWNNVIENRILFDSDSKFFEKLEEQKRTEKEEIKKQKSESLVVKKNENKEKTEKKPRKLKEVISTTLDLSQCLIEDSD